MKRLAALFCVTAMCVSLAACGGKENKESSVENYTENVNPSGGEESSTSTGSAEQNEGNAAGPDLEAGTWSEEMEPVKQAVAEALGDNYFPNNLVEADLLEGLFGIGADLYDDYYAEMPMISTNVDTIVVVKAKADKVADVEAALKAYQEAKQADTMQYPQNIGKIQASVVQTIGNYVCFVQLGGDVTDLLDSGDEAVIAHCQEQNQTAIQAIEATLQ